MDRAGALVGLEDVDDDRWAVDFEPIALGVDGRCGTARARDT
jgi:hypothetical protein